MSGLSETVSLALLLALAVIAIMRLPARRYLLILLITTAVGSWLIGYGAGHRSAANSLYPLLDGAGLQQARAVIQAAEPSPLWALFFCGLIILADVVAFGVDVKRSSRRRQAPDRHPPQVEKQGH